MADYSIIYFSGTGGVRKIAAELEENLLSKSHTVYVCELDHAHNALDYKTADTRLAKSSLLFLLYPIHAFDAPDLVYEWIDNTAVSDKKVAVLSVSGGGEPWPNTGCRVNCNNALEKKGFAVVYEKMMVMPSNWVFEVNGDLAMWLIQSIPEKIENIVTAVLSGKVRRTPVKKKAAFQSLLTRLEKKNAHRFGKSLVITHACTSCGWCADNCPTGNIAMQNDSPLFLEKCVMCFRCIYGCPSHAITSDNFMVLKNGYSLDNVEKQMKGKQLVPVEKCSKGILWKGVANYLLDKDGY